MKNVWILNHYAVAPGESGGTRHYQLAKYLATHGWRTSILAASVDFTSGVQRLNPPEARRLELLGGIPFLWVRTPRYKGNGGGRMLNMLAYAWRVLLPATVRGLDAPDVVIGSSVHPFAALAGALLASRHRVPFVFEVRDLWPQTLIDLGRLGRHSPVAYVMRWLEKWLYSRASRIVTLLPRAVDYIAPLGIDPGKVLWISNGVDIEAFPTPSLPIPEPGVFRLMYFGSHGQANGLDVLLRAMALVKSNVDAPQVQLRLIGEGTMKPALMNMANSLGLGVEWVSFEAPVKKSDIPRLASEADAFVITVLNAPNLYRYGISMNKLFDYMAGRRPIIIASAAINNPIEDAQCGLTVPPDDPVALAAAIVRMAKTPLAQREDWADRGRQHVESYYGYASLAGRLATALDECSSNETKSPKGSHLVTDKLDKQHD